MTTLVLKSKSEENLTLLIQLAQKLGFSVSEENSRVAKIPNEKTLKSFKDAKAGRTTKNGSAEDLMNDLMK